MYEHPEDGTDVSKHVKVAKDYNLNVFVACAFSLYEGWNFNSGNYLFTTDTK